MTSMVDFRDSGRTEIALKVERVNLPKNTFRQNEAACVTMCTSFSFSLIFILECAFNTKYLLARGSNYRKYIDY